MIRVPVSEVIDLMKAEVEGHVDPVGIPFPEVSIDTRTLRSGQAYFALKGKKLDGHAFIAEALDRGASVVVHSSPEPVPSPSAPALLLRVKDTTQALQELAREIRRRWKRPLIGITGSMGKTTTREFCAQLLESGYRVVQSPANFNNEIGVPLSLLGIEGSHEIAVFELAMNRAGEIRFLSSMVQPDAAVLTNVAPVHLEFFPGLDSIADAKAEILEHLNPEGSVFYNLDDDLISPRVSKYSGQKISFSLNRDADVRIRNVRIESLQRMSFELSSRSHGVLNIQVPVAGEHYLYNFAAAAAVALHFGIEPGKVEETAGKLRPGSMRGRIYEICKNGSDRGITIWDDSYNSNPRAVSLILKTLRSLPEPPQMVAVLGEMLELGERTRELHLQVGEQVARSRPRLLVTVGTAAAYIREQAVSAGLEPARAVHFPDSASAAEFVVQNLQRGDLLLVKGSRGVGMDRIVDKVREREQS